MICFPSLSLSPVRTSALTTEFPSRDEQPDIAKGLGPNNKANANGYLQYNEYIAYDVAQLKLRYLFRVGMT